MQKVTGMDADVVSPSNWCTSFSAVHGVAQSRSMKRKLDPKGTPVDQFRALRQIRGLSQEDCRRVIGLLRDDDLGAATCRKNQQKYPEASKLLREVRVPPTNLAVHVNTVPDFVGSNRKVASQRALQ